MDLQNKMNLIIVCGPTASGKTGLGIKLAKALNGEIISADSMQIYKGIPVATAQPTLEERDGVIHHLMGFLDVGNPFSVADYCEMAHKVIEDIVSRGKTPIMVGGTGLYIDSVADDLKFSPCGNTEIRDKLNKEAENLGNEVMFERLREIDPVSAEKIEPNNIRRVIRAIEVYYSTGILFSEYVEISKSEGTRYNEIRFFINYKDREKLYERINERVNIMVEEGLIEEAKEYREKASESGAGQAIGHKEIYPYIDGKISLDDALENLKRATRRYAKRQITWFSRREDKTILFADCEDIYKKAIDILKEKGVSWNEW